MNKNRGPTNKRPSVQDRLLNNRREPPPQPARVTDQNKPWRCICFRPNVYVTCLNCSYQMKGRTRQTCYLHPVTLYLFDVSHCPNCLADLDHICETEQPLKNRPLPGI